MLNQVFFHLALGGGGEKPHGRERDYNIILQVRETFVLEVRETNSIILKVRDSCSSILRLRKRGKGRGRERERERERDYSIIL